MVVFPKTKERNERQRREERDRRKKEEEESRRILTALVSVYSVGSVHRSVFGISSVHVILQYDLGKGEIKSVVVFYDINVQSRHIYKPTS